MDPAEVGRVCVKTMMAPTTSTIAIPIRTILAGGRLRLAVPNSSPISNFIAPDGAGSLAVGAGLAGGGVGGLSGIVDLDFQFRFYPFWMRNAAHQPCFIASPNFCTGRVFSTSSFVSQARRACRTPYRIFSICDVRSEEHTSELQSR